MGTTVVKQGKEAGVIQFIKNSGAGHAGMGILFDNEHVLTCAHVVNVALDRDKFYDREPKQKVPLIFSFSKDKKICYAQVVAWYPIGDATASDIAILKLLDPAPAEIGLAMLADVRTRLDNDDLIIYGVPAGHQSGVYVQSNFVGLANQGAVQLRKPPAINAPQSNMRVLTFPETEFKSAEPNVVQGYSGAAVWDDVHQTTIGMVSAVNVGARGVAYMIPMDVLLRAWPGLPVETRRLPTFFNLIWTVLTSILSAGMIYLFVANRRPVETEPDILAPFWGLHLYAFLAPILGWFWLLYISDFRLHNWPSKMPRFAMLKPTVGSAAEKILAVSSFVFLVLLPLYADAAFWVIFSTRGSVFIYPDQFGYTVEELQPKYGCLPRTTPLCKHPEAGRFSIVTPKPPATGGFWDNAYHYGGEAPDRTVTFFPILQPAILIGLTLIALLTQMAAICLTIMKARPSREPRQRSTS